MTRTNTIATLSLVWGFALGAPDPAAAQVFDTFGFDARSSSLAGAVTGSVEGAPSNYYNPAGLVRSERTHIQVGVVQAFPDFSINGADAGVDEIGGLTLGLAVPGEISGFRFAFGLGVHLPHGRLSRSRSLPRTQPRFEFYDNRPHRTFLGAHVAIRPFDWLLIGGGIAFQAVSENALDLRGGLDFFSPDSDTRLEHEFRATLTTIRYPQVGIQVIPHEMVSVGLVYRHEYALGNDLTAGIDAGLTGVGDPIPIFLDLQTISTNVFVPRQLSLGVTIEPIPRLRIHAEVTWLDWSNYRSAIGRSDVELAIEVPPALEETINVPDEITSTEFIPAEFEDRFVPRIGIEGIPVSTEGFELALRAGYLYENTPVPDQRGVSNLIDNDRHAISLGAGFALTDLKPTIQGRLSLDLHFQWSIIPERVTEKASLVNPIGDYRADGQVYSLAATLGVAL
ncbi:MAG: outer membrane protein transport protein [Myxococcota bacterium]